MEPSIFQKNRDSNEITEIGGALHLKAPPISTGLSQGLDAGGGGTFSARGLDLVGKMRVIQKIYIY